MDFRLWDTVAHNAMLCIMTWLGDGLVVSIVVVGFALASIDDEVPDLPLLGGLEL